MSFNNFIYIVFIAMAKNQDMLILLSNIEIRNYIITNLQYLIAQRFGNIVMIYGVIRELRRIGSLAIIKVLAVTAVINWNNIMPH